MAFNVPSDIFDPDSYFMQKCPPRYRRFSQYKNDCHRASLIEQELSRSNSSPNRPGCASEETSYLTLASLSPRIPLSHPSHHPHHPRQYSEPERNSILVSTASLLSLTNSIDSGYTPTTPSSSRNTTSINTASTNTSDVTPVFFSSFSKNADEIPVNSKYSSLIPWKTILCGHSMEHMEYDKMEQEINKISVNWCRYRHQKALQRIETTACIKEENAEFENLINSSTFLCQALLYARCCRGHLEHLWDSFGLSLSSECNLNGEDVSPSKWEEIDLETESDLSFDEAIALMNLQQHVNLILEVEENIFKDLQEKITDLQTTANELQMNMRHSGGSSSADKLQRLMKSVTSVLHLLCVHGKQVAELESKRYIQEKVECFIDLKDTKLESVQKELCMMNLLEAKSMGNRMIQDDKRLLISILNTSWTLKCVTEENVDYADVIINKAIPLLTDWALISLKSELLQISMKQDQSLLRMLQLFNKN